ncbi:hypothetical protein QYE76_064906 [Lolium multiflorum]|uniref:Uncharacterized protein n=1 Tax=Lolium multiflorum TaxID=4521 RepID=A0AAD8W864_LOLMU|nr:hypothetical protein QYE76_064906 [Lolium multiflorum]
MDDCCWRRWRRTWQAWGEWAGLTTARASLSQSSRSRSKSVAPPYTRSWMPADPPNGLGVVVAHSRQRSLLPPHGGIQFRYINFHWIPRSQNTEANDLAQTASGYKDIADGAIFRRFANSGKFPQNAAPSRSATSRLLRTVPVRRASRRAGGAGSAKVAMCWPRRSSVEVMMAGAVNTGKGVVEEGADRAASTRPAKPPLERDAAPREHLQRHRQPLFKRRCTLATPIAQNIDPAKARRSWRPRARRCLPVAPIIRLGELNDPM